jgi:hypothetical protein
MGIISKEKRAYGVTTSEVSAVFWVISLMVLMMVILNLSGMRSQVALANPELAMQFTFMMSLIFVGVFLSLLSMVLPNYQITKNNLNVLIDKITNPDYVGWLRFTRDKGIRFHTVKKDTGGRTKGMVNDKKASVINNGDYTLSVPNGNKLVCVFDMLSNNDNLEENIGWNLISKHFLGLIGFKAYEKAVDSDRLLFDSGFEDDGDMEVGSDE